MYAKASKRKIGIWEYNRAGVFINLNAETDKEFIEALHKYTLLNGMRASLAIKSLARQHLIREGLINPEVIKPKRKN